MQKIYYKFLEVRSNCITHFVMHDTRDDEVTDRRLRLSLICDLSPVSIFIVNMRLQTFKYLLRSTASLHQN